MSIWTMLFGLQMLCFLLSGMVVYFVAYLLSPSLRRFMRNNVFPRISDFFEGIQESFNRDEEVVVKRIPVYKLREELKRQEQIISGLNNDLMQTAGTNILLRKRLAEECERADQAELRASYTKTSQFTRAEIDKMIRLCHPDKHGGRQSACEITQKLLKMRT